METSEIKDKLRISPSAISCWKDCKWKFKLSYLDKIRPAILGNEYSCFGTAIHAAIAQFYKNGDFSNRELILEPWPEVFLTEVMNKNLKLPEEKICKFEDLGRDTLLSFFDRQQQDELLIIPLLSEKKFIRDFGPFIVVGIVDIAFGDSQIVNIVDFKTNSKAKTKDEIAKDHQLTMYAWLYWKEFGIIPNSLSLHFVKIDKKRGTQRTLDQLLDFEGFLEKFYEDIQNEKEWAINTAHCSWCDFRYQCTRTKNARIRLI